MTEATQAPGSAPRPIRIIRMQERPHWHAATAVIVTMLLYITLPERLTVGENWYVPVLSAALLPPLIITTDLRWRHSSGWRRLLFIALSDESPVQRTMLLVLTGIINAANLGSLVLLCSSILDGSMISGSQLILSGMQIWLTNVIVFGLWYWLLDRGGPAARGLHPHRRPDFLFPQQATPQVAPAGWAPGFMDYLYLAYTNATAFSPTDTMPLASWTKLLMGIQALASLVTAVLVLSRAVNILT